MNMTEQATTLSAESNPPIASRFRHDLRALAGDMEELLRVTASATGEQVATVRAKAEDSLKAVNARLAEAQESALAKTRAAARATDEYVRANPWQVLTIAAGAGVVLGYWLGRCSDSGS